MARTGVTHTDTSEGQGGGKLTEDPVDTGDENAKSEDSLIPASKPGQDPDDVAERMGTTGAGLGISPKPTGG